MKRYSLSHLSDQALDRGLVATVTQDRATTATLLAYLAEADARKRYVPLGYASMRVYCVQALRMSEDIAFKRIRAARAARRLPAILPAIADGRLSLSAVVMLAPHLNRANVRELLAAAEHKTRAEVELLLTRHFPQPDLPARIEAVGPVATRTAPEPHVEGRLDDASEPLAVRGTETAAIEAQVSSPALATLSDAQLAPGPVAMPYPRVTPRSPGRFALQVTLSEQTYEKLRRAQDLLSHQVPSGDLAGVLDRALDALMVQLEKRKCAATDSPRQGRGTNAGPRSIPAQVRRAVWQRDGGQCTFVGASGTRCESRKFIELDHVVPVARGGVATTENLRLRCRAHNQFAASCEFGAGFMEEKREQARQRRATPPTQHDVADAVVPWLRTLGLGEDEAQRAARRGHLADGSIEERVRGASQA